MFPDYAAVGDTLRLAHKCVVGGGSEDPVYDRRDGRVGGYGVKEEVPGLWRTGKFVRRDKVDELTLQGAGSRPLSRFRP